MRRFDDLPLRLKLLLTALFPVTVVVVLVLVAFRTGLTQVREDAVPRQQLVLTLDARTFDYLSEVREFLFHGTPETLEEISEVQEDLREKTQLLGVMAGTDPEHTAIFEAIHTAVLGLLARGDQALAVRQRIGVDLQNDTVNHTLDLPLRRLEVAERVLSEALSVELLSAEEDIDQAFQRFVFFTNSTAILSLVLAVFLALRFGQWVGLPLQKITLASRRFAEGDLTSRVEKTGRDEIGDLAEAFNEMADEQQRLVVTLQENLNILKETQDQLIQSGKLSAIGELAAGVAHELNNPLSAVLTYSLLIREHHDQLPEEIRQQMPRLQRHLGLVATAAKRCKTITDNLLLFARQEESAMNLIELREVVERSFELLGAALRRQGVRLTVTTHQEIPPVRGNFNQLQQVVVNLVTNAQQAIGTSGGSLTVTAEPDPGGAGDLVGSQLTISDDGPGIPAENLERIFDPFFTTKATGKGTGLGLSIVYGIVQRHGGKVTAESTLGRGTTFVVRLPHAKASPVVADVESKLQADSPMSGKS